MIERFFAICAYLLFFVLVVWLCEKYRPAVILGGLLLFVVALERLT